MRTSQVEHGGKAVISLVLGMCSLIMWILLFALGSLIAGGIGTATAVTGLVLGVIGLKSRRAGLSIAGIVTSIMGLILTVIFGLMVVLTVLGISEY